MKGRGSLLPPQSSALSTFFKSAWRPAWQHTARCYRSLPCVNFSLFLSVSSRHHVT